ncbi:hypothetical protein ACWEPL_30845 [Nonomuraea sp. NPDC004186]|uniref:hypothetical protein n=1 Tax=Nonomuraea sp. NPDC049625 TaxID=3155775 RepID=UPI0034187F3D
MLLNYSGGAQVATGAVEELHTRLRAPLLLITIGGFHSGANDLTHADHLHQLTSASDWIERSAPGSSLSVGSFLDCTADTVIELIRACCDG